MARTLFFALLLAASSVPLLVPVAHAAGEKAPAATKWICPMDKEVVSDKPGRCPKCNMKLEPAPAPRK